jgi:hypothetical protein
LIKVRFGETPKPDTRDACAPRRTAAVALANDSYAGRL